MLLLCVSVKYFLHGCAFRRGRWGLGGSARTLSFVFVERLGKRLGENFLRDLGGELASVASSDSCTWGVSKRGLVVFVGEKHYRV